MLGFVSSFASTRVIVPLFVTACPAVPRSSVCIPIDSCPEKSIVPVFVMAFEPLLEDIPTALNFELSILPLFSVFPVALSERIPIP